MVEIAEAMPPERIVLMTPSVSHTAKAVASGDNRALRPANDYRSTTALLRDAHAASAGNIRFAIQYLRYAATAHSNAHGAIRVLTEKVRRCPLAATFVVERNGFVRVEEAA
ncbi:MAG TPA: hypothetical protein VGZ02_10485 [Candidatus Baltobacteraceae bacterium]|jgi:hypothetical protein|nr:hypothetical protein [Candidatus Baltobacteraceae bacterium]